MNRRRSFLYLNSLELTTVMMDLAEDQVHSAEGLVCVCPCPKALPSGWHLTLRSHCIYSLWILVLPLCSFDVRSIKNREENRIIFSHVHPTERLGDGHSVTRASTDPRGLHPRPVLLPALRSLLIALFTLYLWGLTGNTGVLLNITVVSTF